MATYTFHYVYKITNIVDSKYYIGRRSTNLLPANDLGKIYFSSSHDQQFILDQKVNPHQYQYDILAIYKNASDMIEHEIRLHREYDVKRDPLSYNLANSTSVKATFLGRSPNSVTREKMRQKKLGKSLSENHKTNISLAGRGKPKSAMMRQRLRKSIKGKKKPENIRAMLRLNSANLSELVRQNYYRVSRINDQKCMTLGTFHQWLYSLEGYGLVCRISDQKLLTVAQYTHWLKSNANN